MRIAFNAPAELMNMNQRGHWTKQRRLARWWRQAAMIAATNAGIKNVPPAFVRIDLPVRTNRRRDPHNYFPTVKHIIDGLVDAGLWPDDTPEWVTTVEPTLTVRPVNTVFVDIDPREPSLVGAA